MFPKLVALTLLLIGLAAGLLLLRQHRLELAHLAARTHAQAIQTRQELWATQAEAAMLITPESIQERIARTEIAVEPAVPDPLVQRGQLAGAR